MNNRKIVIEMTTGNDAFLSEYSVAQALRALADRIDSRGLDNVSKVLDDNGQSVGTVVVTDA